MDRTSAPAATWFDTARIESTVTREFARSQLLPDEVGQLDRPLAFGDGLTDCTYWEWIQSKAKRLFLILVDLDLADQIFGVVDDSWEDDDLPVALNQVERLSLTASGDPRTERKFFHRQFHYLLRPLGRGEHADYQEAEVVPLDVHERRPGLAQGHHHHHHSHDVDRVGLPNEPGRVFCRRRFPVGPEAGCMPREQFLAEVALARDLEGEHVVSYWASYTHQGYGYVLFTPASEYRLGAYLAGTPPPVKSLDKPARRRLVLDWIHCLADTLCLVHAGGAALGNIKPSTIFFTHANHICLSPPGRLHPDAAGGQGHSFDKEAYDYAAPEQRTAPAKHAPVPARPRASGPSSSRGSTIPPGRSGSTGRGHHHTEQHKLASPPPKTPPQQQQQQQQQQQRPSSSSSSSHHHSDHSSSAHHHTDPQAADIFSAGCIILELLSHGLLKRSAGSFASHRGARHKNAGRGGAVLDSSFHRNLGQVETWMGGLARDADKKARRAAGGEGAREEEEGGGARLFRGVTPLLHVVERMLSPHPPSRPSAPEVQRAVYQILTEVSGVTATHCARRRHGAGAPGLRDSGGGGAMATIEEADISPTTTIPPAFGFGTHHHDYAYAYGDDAGTRRSNSLRSFVGLAHRRDSSDESVSSKSRSSSSNQSYGERRDAPSGLRALQNLRISKSWQPNPPAERDIASRHSR